MNDKASVPLPFKCMRVTPVTMHASSNKIGLVVEHDVAEIKVQILALRVEEH
jgi:hypothetical protein